MDIEVEESLVEDVSAQLERYRNLALISTDWFWETDTDFVITYMTASVKRITGFPSTQYIGVSRFDLASEDTKKTKKWADHMAQVKRQEPIKNFEYKHVGDGGATHYLRVNAAPLLNESGRFRGYLGSTTDITELVEAKMRVEAINAELQAAKLVADELARTDGLTGLNNRRAFFERAQEIQDQARRYKRHYAVMMLDVDHFKAINDTHGHGIGDEALKEVAATIKSVTRESDVVGRIGGEEFAVLLPETKADSAMALAERLRQALADVVVPVPQGEVTFTASIGVAECCNKGSSVEDAIARADKALYEAKEGGRDRVVLFKT